MRRNIQGTWYSHDLWPFLGFVCVAVLWFFCASFNLVLAANEPVGLVTNAVGEIRVLRAGGLEELLYGKGSLPIYQGDRVQTQKGSLAQLTLMDGIEIVMNEGTEFLILSRWEKANGVTRILRITKGELWVAMEEATLPLEVESPVAIAGAGISELPSQAEEEFDPYGPFEQSVQELLKNQHTEFNLRVAHDGQTTLQVHKGIVEFGSAFNTWALPPSTMSVAARGQRCTRPEPIDVQTTLGWKKSLDE